MCCALAQDLRSEEEKSTLGWDAEEKLGYPALKEQSAIMSKTYKLTTQDTKATQVQDESQLLGMYEDHRISNKLLSPSLSLPCQVL